MSTEERRATPRVALRLPLKIRPLEPPEASEMEAFSVNVSEGGMLFTVPRPLPVGTPLELTMTMPGEITGGSPMQVNCTARVLRSDPRHPLLGLPVSAAAIERYNTIWAQE